MPKGDKTPTIYNWLPLYTEFKEAKEANPDMTLRAWCEVKGLKAYTNVSREFAELSRLDVAETGAVLAPKAMRKLGALIQSKDETIAQKASTAILDRTGFSPKEQIVNVQNNISLGITLFAKEDQDKIKSMFEGQILDEV